MLAIEDKVMVWEKIFQIVGLSWNGKESHSQNKQENCDSFKPLDIDPLNTGFDELEIEP